jgi:hypothetical protein
VNSYPFTGIFFQGENTKCTIFELNRLIGCQTQEKRQKCSGLAKIMIFAKKYCWVHDSPASMAMLPGAKFSKTFVFRTLRRNKNHKNLDIESFIKQIFPGEHLDRR